MREELISQASIIGLHIKTIEEAGEIVEVEQEEVEAEIPILKHCHHLQLSPCGEMSWLTNDKWPFKTRNQ